MIYYDNTINSGLSKEAIEYICGILALTKFVKKAWLYGSRADGTARYNSDIDIAVEGDLSLRELDIIYTLLDALPMPYLFDIVDKSKITNKSFLNHINTDGKLIYSRDDSND